MIAASEPQEFEPRGRQQVLNHPGDVGLKCPQPQLHPESLLLQQLSQVAISKQSQVSLSDEQWHIRSRGGEFEAADTGAWSLSELRATSTEEELYVRGTTAVWSRGGASHIANKVVVCCYTSENPIRHALWCNFHRNTPGLGALGRDRDLGLVPPDSLMPSVCIVDSENIKAFTSDGEDYVATLQFEVSGVWPCSYGLLLERGSATTGPARPGLSQSPMAVDSLNPHLPTVFSLSHPLDEIIPVIAKHGTSLGNVCDPQQKIVFTNNAPSICMLYDSGTGLHSIWKIRKTLHDEYQALGTSHSMSSMLNHSSVTTGGGVSSSAASNTSASGSLGRPSLSRAVAASLLRGEPASPFAGSRTSLGSSPLTSRPHSPALGTRESWTTSVRSFAAMGRASPQPTVPRPLPPLGVAKSWLSSTTLPGTPPPDSRLMTSQAVDSQLESQPLLPELCLEHVWTENHGVPRDRMWGPASRVFLTTDLVGQTYLCYLVPTCSQLLCARLERSNNEKQLIFGIVSTIPAKDAASLPHLHMTAVMEPVGGVVLYSGLTLVGKVHVAGIPSALATSSYLAGFGSPFPKRSSMLVSSRPTSAMEPAAFAEEVHLLSPVTAAQSSPPPPAPALTSSYTPLRVPPLEDLGTACPTSVHLLMEPDLEAGPSLPLLSTPRRSQPAALRDAVDNRVTLELSDGSMFRIALPELCSSPLVFECLAVLRQVLPRDLAMQLLVRWYAARNAPGSQDISPSQEWQLFVRVLLELSGYEVEKLKLVQAGEAQSEANCSADMPSTPVAAATRASGAAAATAILRQSSTPAPTPSCQHAAKKKRSSDAGSEDDWEFVLKSELHAAVGQGLAGLLGLRHVPPPHSSHTATVLGLNPVQKPAQGRVDPSAALLPSLPVITFALHLLYEEMKLNLLLAECLPMLALLLHQLCADLRLSSYCLLYWRDFPVHCTLLLNQDSQIHPEDLQRLAFPPFIDQQPPDVFNHLYGLIRGLKLPAFPYIRHVNPKTRDIIKLTALVTHGSQASHVPLGAFVRPVVPVGSRCEPAATSPAQDFSASTGHTVPQQAVLLMTEMGITRRDLETMPSGIGLLLNSVLYQCRHCPPADWPEAAYQLVLRQDLAALCRQPAATNSAAASTSSVSTPAAAEGPQPPAANPGAGAGALAQGAGAAAAAAAAGASTAAGTTKSTAAATVVRPNHHEEEDGMEGMNTEILKLRFSKDHRAAEVRRLLQSSQPVRIAITQRPEVSDHEFIEEQERHLYAMCTRTMALPVGRGMFTLRTATPVVTEVLPIPRLCLTGRAPPRGTTVDLSHIEVVPNMNLWPLFHNGVAAGLRIVPNASDIESTWIVYNKPKGPNDMSTEHAGFLMALGLNGHLNNLARWNAYEYLVKCHEMTSVGLLLGIAAAKRGTMDVATTKTLSLHLEALLPPTSIELDIQQNVQVAALLGVGLVYQGTAHRCMAEVLLSEIGRPPGPEMENSVDRESYSLAAGLALGLVVLGRGSQLSGLGDLQIPNTLHYYMVGGHKRPFTGSQKEKYKSPSYQIREGDQVNIDVTSPGATLALGMMFFNTGNRAVADWMQAPNTQYLLDFVRPDFLLLRIVARSLILWDDIQPSAVWVEHNIPASIRPYCLVKPQPGATDSIDYETMNQAYCNILAGACMALGLKYAGSCNQEAFATLIKYAHMFTSLSGKSIAELAGKSTIETCLNVILLSLAAVMAGSGDLEVLRLCRHLRARVGPASSVVTYGSHLATHMALGLLFLGGGRYTLATSPAAVAAMLCAFFPKFPTHSNDNRYHLQAFRHLYVLAAEPRLVLPRDIDTHQLCYAHLRVVFLPATQQQPQELRLQAPALLPELSKLQQVTVEDDRYWTIEFRRDSNWAQLQNLLHNSGCVEVKQRAGCLSYLEDPHGFRSLLAQTLTLDPAISWSVRAESISAFSSDPNVVNFAKYFLEQDGLKCSDPELRCMQALTMLAYECVTQDKLAILPIWIALQKVVQSLSSIPSVFLMWQLKLVMAQVEHCSSSHSGHSGPPLVSPDLALCLHQQITRVLDVWELDLVSGLHQYLTGHCPSTGTKLQQLTAFLVYHDIPSPQALHGALKHKTQDPLALHMLLADLHLPARALLKLASLLKRVINL